MPTSQTESYFEKSLVRFFRKTYAISVGFKMKLLRNQPKFYGKTCWKDQPFIFTIYSRNHIIQTSALLTRDNEIYNRT